MSTVAAAGRRPVAAARSLRQSSRRKRVGGAGGGERPAAEGLAADTKRARAVVAPLLSGCAVFIPAVGGGHIPPEQRRILAARVRERAGVAADGARELAGWRRRDDAVLLTHVVACDGSPLAAAAASQSDTGGALVAAVFARAVEDDPALAALRNEETCAQSLGVFRRSASSSSPLRPTPRAAESVLAAARAVLERSSHFVIVRPEWIGHCVRDGVLHRAAEYCAVAPAFAAAPACEEAPVLASFAFPAAAAPAPAPPPPSRTSTSSGVAEGPFADFSAVSPCDASEFAARGWLSSTFGVPSSAAEPPPPPLPAAAASRACAIPEHLRRRAQTFACMRDEPVPASSGENPSNLNAHITAQLVILQKRNEVCNDKWRAPAYRKAIAAIAAYPTRIERPEELDGIRGLGVRMKEKVREILRTGTLPAAATTSEREVALELFTGVWGAGPARANTWISQGFRTLEHLRGPDARPFHTASTLAGLAYYDDLRLKIPRAEVEEISEVVRRETHEVDPDLRCETTGSYRRGKQECGDVDILITHSKGGNVDGVLGALLARLHRAGLLQRDLTNEPGSNKYMGICRLRPELPHRHIDLKAYPLEQFAAALLYFTGSAYFNRSMRLYAKKAGYQLSDKGIRLRESPEYFPVSSEADIFRCLGMEYKPPEMRNHEST